MADETPTPRTVTDAAEWLLNALATATQDRRFLRDDPDGDRGLCSLVLLNGEKAIRRALAQRDADVAAWREAAARVCLPGVAFAEPDEWTRAMTRAAVSLLDENARLREHEQEALAAHGASVAALVAVAGALGLDGVGDYADVERAASALRAERDKWHREALLLDKLYRTAESDRREMEAADGAELTALRAKVTALREALEKIATMGMSVAPGMDEATSYRLTVGDCIKIAARAIDAARAKGGEI